ncbi:RNA polymerase sigma factor [Pseudorhodoferax sp. Leaf274]|uniref:RNA polymerase sigma factor n=1 Tax=Pseudorhodoferax sp. Leaf274 TaxID=1736318 RepID=UPI001F3E0A93|nr:sigma-70 family RNA polymerase sigma factor [Pseudorhodoferax sp. Leaf274]
MLQSRPSSPLLAALVRHYEDLVERLRWRFGDRALAREVVHDVCVDLLERPRRDPVEHPLALLRRMSHDRAVDRVRTQDRERRWVDAAEVLPDVASEQPGAASTLQARQELELLCRTVEAMPERCRLVFVMHKIHELPQAEVAAQLGISLKTVEKHLRLGMAACRAALQRGAAA